MAGGMGVKEQSDKSGYFSLQNCGHAEHADINAAKDISQRASVNRPTASGVGHTCKREPYES